MSRSPEAPAGQVTLEREGPIGWVLVDNQARRNAVTSQMWRQLRGCVDELGADPSVRVLVIRGAGDVSFVAGADISEMASPDRRAGAGQGSAREIADAAYQALENMDKPVLAMINGHCAGGGVNLALTADLRYASDQATFAVPAARLGVPYHWRHVARLAELIGPAAAADLLLTGRTVGGDVACGMGLVNAVVPKHALEETVRALANDVASNAPLAVRCVKLALRHVTARPVKGDTVVLDAAMEACLSSDDLTEGIRAFMDRRRPLFRGC